MNGPAPGAIDYRKVSLSVFQRRDVKMMLFLIALIFISFPIVMSTLAPYDDEGYVMMTLRTFIDGEPLYSGTHTQYGPAYYFLSGAFHSVFGLPLNQDWVRLKTIVFWCISTALCYAVLRRLSVAEPLRTMTALLFHVHLNKLSLEPGHPRPRTDRGQRRNGPPCGRRIDCTCWRRWKRWAKGRWPRWLR